MKKVQIEEALFVDTIKFLSYIDNCIPHDLQAEYGRIYAQYEDKLNRIANRQKYAQRIENKNI